MDPFSAILGIGTSILGGISGQAEADAQNEAIERQHQYDSQSWRFGKQRIRADYRHSKKQWKYDIKNDKRAAAYRDKTNLQDWQYQLKIQDHEYRSQMRQYAKSEQIYGQQLTFNKMAADAAKEAEYRKLQDSTNEIAFQNQDIVIKSMAMEGAAAVKGQQGRSADKNVQSVFASLGRNQAILAESLLSAKADTTAAMKKIATDKFGADIAAQAARMLKPDRLPQPPKPIATPRTKFLKPRRPKDYDFGPKPIKGAAASSAGAWMGAATDGIGSIAGMLGGGGSKYNFSLGGTDALSTKVSGWNL
jgi:hypothetical protein